MHSFSFVLEVRGPIKYHRKRAYFGTSTAVPYVVYGTVRTRMIRTRHILRILVSHDTGSVSRSHTHWYASTSIAERGFVVWCRGMQYFEYRKFSKYFGCLHCCCCGYRLCSGLCTANHTLVYQYEYVQGHCLSKRMYRYLHETRTNVLSVEQNHTTYCRPG